MWLRRYLVRIPIAVKDDDGVGSLQVEAEAASSGAQQEDEVLRSFLIKFLQQHGSVLRLGGACNRSHQSAQTFYRLFTE